MFTSISEPSVEVKSQHEVEWTNNKCQEPMPLRFSRQYHPTVVQSHGPPDHIMATGDKRIRASNQYALSETISENKIICVRPVIIQSVASSSQNYGPFGEV